MRDSAPGVVVSLLAILAAGCVETTEQPHSPRLEPGPTLVEPARSEPPLDPGLDLGDRSLEVGSPIREGNLIVWPVTRDALAAAPASAPEVEYLTLDEAFERGLAQVQETGDVNRLTLTNDSAQPLLLLAGEVLDGGQQDRIVAQDTVVAPGEKAQLGSFCVEAGRWSVEPGDDGGGRTFAAGNPLASNAVRIPAQVTKSQQHVWSGVDYAARANSAATSTGTFMAVVQKPEVRQAVDERAAVFAEALRAPRAVGFVAAVDWGEETELVAAEIFGSPELFASFREKLVRSYCLDAVTLESGAAAELSELAVADIDVTLAQSAALDVGVVFEGLPALIAPPLTLSAVSDPDVVVSDGRVEAGTASLKHLHRTIYKKK